MLGADHDTEHKVVKYGLWAPLGDISKIHVIIMQFVRLIRDGKEVKMSTRRGNYETLDDLIGPTSPDAVRYMLLARSANSRLGFRPRSGCQAVVGQSGRLHPVRLRAHRRNPARGGRARFLRRGCRPRPVGWRGVGVHQARLTLGDEIALSTQTFETHRIAFFAQDLANLFHPMYDRVRVFGEGIDDDIARARRRFYKGANVVFRRVLSLMGMSTPDRM
ncbi:MAG: hypothetical protein HND48_13650 [Chloroflexi bacterium]|nr:hypothetical protein [Chloroflexota bacterium]